jgi:hypothetical protein
VGSCRTMPSRILWTISHASRAPIAPASEASSRSLVIWLKVALQASSSNSLTALPAGSFLPPFFFGEDIRAPQNGCTGLGVLPLPPHGAGGGGGSCLLATAARQLGMGGRYCVLRDARDGIEDQQSALTEIWFFHNKNLIGESVSNPTESKK